MTLSVPFLDMKAQYDELMDEFDLAYQRVMDSGWYILSDEVHAFEQEFAEYIGVKYCVGVGNGLEALELILMGYGIGEEDEVIVPANTYIASWLAVSYVGATSPFRSSRTRQLITSIPYGLQQPSPNGRRRSCLCIYTANHL